MNLQTVKYFRRSGFGLFDLLCFIAACSLVLPLATTVSRHYEGHQRTTVFCLFMLILYPILGFSFVILMHVYFRRQYRKRHGTGVAATADKKSTDR